jgi:hypothetical protein
LCRPRKAGQWRARRTISGSRSITAPKANAGASGRVRPSVNVRRLKHGIGFQHGGATGAIAEHVQHHRGRYAAPSDHGFAAHFSGFGSNAIENLAVVP